MNKKHTVVLTSASVQRHVSARGLGRGVAMEHACGPCPPPIPRPRDGPPRGCTVAPSLGFCRIQLRWAISRPTGGASGHTVHGPQLLLGKGAPGSNLRLETLRPFLMSRRVDSGQPILPAPSHSWGVHRPRPRRPTPGCPLPPHNPSHSRGSTATPATLSHSLQ